MKILKYNSSRRSEVDPDVINNLLRKGWEDVTPLDPPLYDPKIEYILYDESSNSFLKKSFSQEELNENFLQEKKFNISLLIQNGFLVQPENFVLGLGDNDRSSFSQMLALVKEALDLGLIDNDSPQTIADKDGQKHEISTIRFRQIMVAYGMYYKSLWDSL